MSSAARSKTVSPLSNLREATSETHAALHVHPLMIALGEGRAGRSELQAALPVFHGFHAACDERFAQHRLPGFVPSPHMAWLNADLRISGFGEARIAALPHCSGIPPIVSRGDLLGHLYVREGSTLGGQTIARHLARTLGDDADSGGYRFFAGHGPKETGARWRFLVSAIEAATPREASDAGRTAARLFAALEAWLWTCYRNAP